MAFVPIVGSTDFMNRVLELEDDVLHHASRKLITDEGNNRMYLNRATILDSYNMFDLHIDSSSHLRRLPGIFAALSSVLSKLRRQRKRFDDRELYRGFAVGRAEGHMVRIQADRARHGFETVNVLGEQVTRRKQKLAESTLAHIRSYL